MNDQIGWAGLVERLQNEAPRYAQLLPELPRLLHQVLQRQAVQDESPLLHALLAEQRRSRRLLQGLVWGVAGFAGGVAVAWVLLTRG
jgi:ubiquinone biosynthesis protein